MKYQVRALSREQQLQTLVIDAGDEAGARAAATAQGLRPLGVSRLGLATLRRQRGFKITVREPFAIESYVFDSDADETVAGVLTQVTGRRGRTVRLPVSNRLLREMARHKGAPLGLTGTLRDREGNYRGFDHELDFKP